MEITAHIVYLLQLHDYVAIPGLGGFVAQYQSAERHPVSHTITPPCKQVTFNRQLHGNDGLLLHRLVEVSSVTPEEARLAIHSYAASIKEQLDRREVVKLSGVGKLFLDVEGNTRFVQASDTNLLPESFGLPTLQLQPVLRQKLVDLGPAVEVTSNKQRPVRKWYAAAAMVAIVLSLVTTYLTVPTLQQKTNILFGWDTSFTSSPLLWQDMSLLPLADADITAYHPLSVSVTLEHNSVALTAADLEQPLTFEANSGIPKGYFVIIGSFNKAQNAHQLLQELSDDGHDAWSFPTTENGFTRVGVFVSANDLLKANKQVRQWREWQQSDAWILFNK